MQRCSKRRKTGYLRGAANVVRQVFVFTEDFLSGSMPDTSSAKYNWRQTMESHPDQAYAVYGSFHAKRTIMMACFSIIA